MITEADIARIDQSKIYLVYEQWPEHFRKAMKIGAKADHDPDFYNSIILCGMGGSATSCDVLNQLIRNFSDTPSTVLRGEEVQSSASKHSLVIINSVSGNTQEAIMMLQSASKKNAEVICISAGGKLKELALRHGHKHIEIPNLSLPRASLPYLVIPGLRLINPFFRTSLESDLLLLPKNLEKIAKRVSFKVHQGNTAKRVAEFFDGFAFCFASPSLVSVATRFKNSLNENAKIHCLSESVLEASHNEIVPFTYNNALNAKALFLRWAGDPPLVKERFKKINKLFADVRLPVMEITAFEKSLLNAIICSIYMLDYATIYKAVSRGIDPSPTPAIDVLKKL